MVVAFVDKELGGMTERTYGPPDVLVESLYHFLVSLMGAGDLDQPDHFLDRRDIAVFQITLHNGKLLRFGRLRNGFGFLGNETASDLLKIEQWVLKNENPNLADVLPVLENLTFLVYGQIASTGNSLNVGAALVRKLMPHAVDHFPLGINVKLPVTGIDGVSVLVEQGEKTFPPEG